MPGLASRAGGSDVSAMSLNQLFLTDASFRFQVIDVLSHIQLKKTLVLEQLDEMMGCSGHVIVEVQKVFGQSIKCLRLLVEELNVKYRFRLW